MEQKVSVWKTSEGRRVRNGIIIAAIIAPIALVFGFYGLPFPHAESLSARGMRMMIFYSGIACIIITPVYSWIRINNLKSLPLISVCCPYCNNIFQTPKQNKPWGEAFIEDVKVIFPFKILQQEKPFSVKCPKCNKESFFKKEVSMLENFPKENKKDVIPIVLPLINSVIALLYSFAFIFYPGFFGVYPGLGLFIGIVMLVIALILFTGVILIKFGRYMSGAVFSFIGGALTIPIGFLGIFGGLRAWKYYTQSKTIMSIQQPFVGYIPPMPTQPRQVIPPLHPVTSTPQISCCCPYCSYVFQITPTKKPFKAKCPSCNKESMLR